MNASHHTPAPWPFAPLTPMQQRRNAEALAWLQREEQRLRAERLRLALAALKGNK